MLRHDCALDDSTIDKNKCIHFGYIKKCPAGCTHFIWHINAEPTETEEFYNDIPKDEEESDED